MSLISLLLFVLPSWEVARKLSFPLPLQAGRILMQSAACSSGCVTEAFVNHLPECCQHSALRTFPIWKLIQ